ncbi:SRR1-like protein [Leucoraja erinacea]|uniref:SRR1-like protein n=1 Tax=Leucoraja erinaceus TaxID=7782 RepID=UPI002457B2A1|nr:SRR1-like protein [Leucoraja erinacea]
MAAGPANGGWETVGKRRAKRREAGGRTAERPSVCEGDKVRHRLQETVEELRSSEFWAICRESVQRAVNKYRTTPKAPASSCSPDVGAAKVLEDQKDDIDLCQTTLDLVCYGIGNFSDSVASRYQLALLFLLLETLQIPQVSCLLFDPLFTEWEKSFLKDCGMVVITENEEGKRPINRPTLFYMVHCGKALYNNLLWRNWSPQQLAQTILIGNSFKGIEERSPARILQRDYTYISSILAVTEEAAFPDSNRYLDVFNDTSIHQFPREKLDAKPKEFWEGAAEPMYQQCEDLEIIQNG